MANPPINMIATIGNFSPGFLSDCQISTTGLAIRVPERSQGCIRRQRRWARPPHLTRLRGRMHGDAGCNCERDTKCLDQRHRIILIAASYTDRRAGFFPRSGSWQKSGGFRERR
jgi:hypothetical protein